MPNKKISQLSGISPVPTGALMIIANSGVSRNAYVRDVANAIQASTSTFVGLTDTPSGIPKTVRVSGVGKLWSPSTQPDDFCILSRSGCFYNTIQNPYLLSRPWLVFQGASPVNLHVVRFNSCHAET